MFGGGVLSILKGLNPPPPLPPGIPGLGIPRFGILGPLGAGPPPMLTPGGALSYSSL